MCAREFLVGEVMISYSDIWYDTTVLSRLLSASGDLVLACDTQWKASYENRKEHPVQEAERARWDSDHRVRRIGKFSPDEFPIAGTSEFIGLTKFSTRGCEIFKSHYDRCQKMYRGQRFQRAKVFENAYLTDLFQEMTDQGVRVLATDVGNRWREIDTIEDYENVKRSMRAIEKIS
jgi:choline kinase